MLRGYERAALTLNFVRSLIDGGFADLHHPENWDLAFVGESAAAADYHALVQSVSDSLGFFEAITGEPLHSTHRVEFYTSHEGLHLPYEQAQTRFLKHRDHWYNLTTHYPWIGMRTADFAGAHIEYFRGIANPMGVKIGTSVSDEQLQQLVHVLEPEQRAGAAHAHHAFRREAHRGAPAARHQGRARDGFAVCCGSATRCTAIPRRTAEGYKTRRFDNIRAEVRSAFRIHQEQGSYLGGVHLELTGDNVTECIGGARGLKESDLARAYKSQVDPRLNYEQAMEIAMLIAGRLHTQD